MGASSLFADNERGNSSTLDAGKQTPSLLLFYDGSCGLCARSVQFVLSAERDERSMLFFPLDGEMGQRLLGNFPSLHDADSLVLYAPGVGPAPPRLLLRSDAVLALAHYLGGIWRIMAFPCRLVPRSIRDLAYSFVATHRHRLSADKCVNPGEEQLARFPEMVRDAAEPTHPPQKRADARPRR